MGKMKPKIFKGNVDWWEEKIWQVSVDHQVIRYYIYWEDAIKYAASRANM